MLGRAELAPHASSDKRFEPTCEVWRSRVCWTGQESARRGGQRARAAGGAGSGHAAVHCHRCPWQSFHLYPQGAGSVPNDDLRYWGSFCKSRTIVSCTVTTVSLAARTSTITTVDILSTSGWHDWTLLQNGGLERRAREAISFRSNDEMLSPMFRAMRRSCWATSDDIRRQYY